MIYFTLYNALAEPTVSENDMLKKAKEFALFARIENSGAEGRYIEIARCNESSFNYQRYAFYKFFSEEERKEAEALVSRLNSLAYSGEECSFIHKLPTYTRHNERDHR